ncbi:ATP-binding protein [Isoptericola jiangsuensis]|uniref:ATP-binding protein n=1 Tax=Isoptericola jiangsuensis TaxID=548579 RepID=UPI003AAEB5BC
MTTLLSTVLTDDAALFALRRAGREICSMLGLDAHAQVRLATALSELGRAALDVGPVEVELRTARRHGTVRLQAELRPAAALQTSGDPADGGLPAARRLVDSVEVSADGRRVVLTVELGASVRLDDAAVELLARSVSAGPATDALDELRLQNADLLRAHDELRVQQEELRRLNAELQETNRHARAMYDQLSAELEETNSGVVALYAELDERSQELQATNEAKSRFLRNVSHELRSPVNSIIGLASLLAESPLDGDQTQQVAYVRDSAGTLLTLVDELLDLARAEAGHQDVTPEPIDLTALFDELRGTIAPLTRPGVELVVAAAHGVSLVSDRDLLARVLRNLLTNAVKFTEAGSVRLDATTDDVGRAVLTVRDTGVGIPADQVATIFEEFVQVPNHLQPSVRGTGLGLPYARRTAEALGGSLVARSEAGEGSTFTVTLPSLEASPDVVAPAVSGAGTDGTAPDGAAPTPVPVAAPAPSLGHVLVVDDDRAFGAVVAGFLRDEASQVSVAHDPRHALALLRDGPADAVVLDVCMPGIDGATLLSRVRATQPAIPAVLMSSGPPPEVPDQAGPFAFLPKSGMDRPSLVAALQDQERPDR